MTREQAIDSLGYGMFANNSELVHDIFNYFEKEIKNLDVAINIYQGALESSSKKQASLEQRNTELERRVKELEEPKTCEGCKHYRINDDFPYCAKYENNASFVCDRLHFKDMYESKDIE